MKVKIFVDWSRQEIMNQKEGEEKLASHLKDQADYEDYRTDYLNDIIEDWLKKHPTTHYSEFYKKIFDLSAEERAEIEAKCRESYKEQVEQDFFDDWEEVEIEVQGVEIPPSLFAGEFSISIQKLSNTKRGGSLTPKRPEILLYHAPPNLSRVF